MLPARRTAVPSLALAAVSAMMLTGCAGSASGPAASGRIAVVASTDVWGDLASSIGGSAVSVTSIIDDPDKDPHEYEADARTQLALSKAAVVIENGGGYDDFVGTMRKAAGARSTLLDAVDISGKRAAAGDDLNEHVWYDFPTVEKVIDRISGAFTGLDAKDAASFRGNADALKQQLDALEQREADLKTRYAGTGASITEPVPLYMLDAIGLTNLTPPAFSEAIEGDTDAAPAVLNETLDLYRDRRVRLLAYNEQTTGAQTEAVLNAAEQNGIAVVPVTETLPEGKTYVSWMTDNLDAIQAALGS